jgi:DNA-binding XRE family transcriptional regulator
VARGGGSVRASDDIGSAGVRIKDRRKSLGLSQQALSEQAGVSRQTVVSLGATVEELWG